jgi:acetyl/propionyl-CoA carboxylase alpha subunit
VTAVPRIHRLLVANRGEIALRVMRTARALGIETVAVHSDPDADAPHVRFADRSVRLPGSASAETYLVTDAILAAAAASGADAIHPGYGFLSENPAFARAVTAAGLVWVGPTPQSIEAMALKVEAKRIAAAAGVPLVPGAELDAGSDAQAVCDAVGYPLLIKASAGGGGKGMKVVTRPEDLAEALDSARREAGASFGDDTVFVERYLAGARHVEVQVFGDTHGEVVHLFERECSIQRRHQKVVEEAPSPGVTAGVRARLHEAAVSLARAIGYVGAGTVEFMVFGDGPGQEFFFLEMNTRLQVEHPVTELITGLDLVAWQLAVAQGQALPLGQDAIAASGHAIEARLYAEDPARDHLPATGTLHDIAWPAGLRVDSGVVSGSVISPFYDPMIAKVVAHGATRTEAALRLADGLQRSVLHGPVNNRSSLVAILRSDSFLAGDTTTAFLDDHPEVLAPEPSPDDVSRHLVAAAVTVLQRAAGELDAPLGWRNVPGPPEFATLAGSGAFSTVLLDSGRVRIARTQDAPYGRVFDLPADDLGPVRWCVSGPGVVEVEIGGVAARCRVALHGSEVFVDDGVASTAWSAPPRFADHSLDAAGHGPSTPVPGTITAVLVAPGDVVAAGQTLVVLEAMKMEHRIAADIDATVADVHVAVGQSVDAHTVVVSFADVDEEPS